MLPEQTRHVESRHRRRPMATHVIYNDVAGHERIRTFPLLITLMDVADEASVCFFILYFMLSRDDGCSGRAGGNQPRGDLLPIL